MNLETNMNFTFKVGIAFLIGLKAVNLSHLKGFHQLYGGIEHEKGTIKAINQQLESNIFGNCLEYPVSDGIMLHHSTVIKSANVDKNFVGTVLIKDWRITKVNFTRGDYYINLLGKLTFVPYYDKRRWFWLLASCKIPDLRSS